MRISTTRGIDGDKLEVLAEGVKSTSDAWKIIYDFKDKSLGKMKVEVYDRILKLDDNSRLAVDFGNYSTFILVEAENDTSAELCLIDTFWNAKINE